MNKYISLKDFLDKQITGDWGKEVSDNKYNTKVYCIRGADINAINGGDYNNLPIRYIEKKNKSKFLKEGHIVIEISGGSPIQSTGRVSYIRGFYTNIICSNFCRAFAIKKEHSPKFFYYLVKNIYNSNIFFNFESKTTGIKNLLFDIAFESVKVPNVSLTNQLSIAKILSDLDAKIELNNQINQELEAMAKMLYDYWFVQFDFPNEEGKPYKSSGGKMVYNEELKREIPEGWEVEKLSQIADTGSGATPLSTNKEYYDKGNIPWINSGEVNRPFIISTDNFITQKGFDNSSVNMFKRGTILMAMYGATAGKVSFMDIEACTNQAICAINPHEDFYRTYMKFGLEDLYQYLVNLSSGSARDNLSQTKIRDLKFIIPNDVIIKKYDKLVQPSMEKILINLKQNQNLAELRDWLLPMLMNGQVKVEGAEVVEEEFEEALGVVAEAQGEYGKA